jgi:hypothetical protein
MSPIGQIRNKQKRTDKDTAFWLLFLIKLKGDIMTVRFDS